MTLGVQYTTRKSIAKGMLDMALLLSNVSKMKKMLSLDCIDSVKCVTGVVFLSISVCLQVAVGVMLIVLAIREQYAVKEQERKLRENSKKLLRSGSKSEPSEPNSSDSNSHRDHPKMKRQLSLAAESTTLSNEKLTMRLNTAVLILVFIIVVLNVIIDGMDLSDPPPGVESPVKSA
ncbi:unnamed protein product [Mytilus coruscus]|uniref:Ninjurin-1 n=1 Tax=Mytilus coruscus TaxID=42192 RepID=A0A6J8B4T9_MYTCO|nr:unnamed protein product [Mytilus coruscus]